jgi:hypothetical protein
LKGIAFMEAIVAPQGRDHWDKMGMRPALEALRSEAGEAMVLQNDCFIEEILPNAILRKLSAEQMAEYRRPFAEPGEGRRPTLTWPRQIPIEGEAADVHAIATEYADWLGTSNVPKLFLKADPGAILANDTLVNLVRGWPALTEKTVAGIHFVQEICRTRSGGPLPAGWRTCNGPSSSTQSADRLDDRTIAGSNVGGVSSDRGDQSHRRVPREGKSIQTMEPTFERQTAAKSLLTVPHKAESPWPFATLFAKRRQQQPEGAPRASRNKYASAVVTNATPCAH